MHRIERPLFWLALLTSTLLMTSSASFATSPLPATVAAVSVDGVDLHATVLWLAQDPPPAALVVLQDIHGDEVTSTLVTLSAGEPSDVILAQAFADVLEHGLQYRVLVETAFDGELLSNPLPVSVRLQCSAGLTCEFTVVAGIHHDSDTIVISAELAQALEEASGGDEDLFTAVLQAHSGLLSEVLSYLVELEVFESSLAESGQTQPGDCTCHWTAVVETVGVPSCGLGQLIQALSGGGLAQATAVGSTALTMELQCLRTPRRTTGSPLTLPGGQAMEVFDQVFDVCDTGCSSSNIHTLLYGAYAMAGGGPAANTSAEVIMDFTVDGQPVGDATVAASKRYQETVTDEDWLVQGWQAAGTTAMVATNAQATATLPYATYPGGSLSEAQFVLSTHGSAVCVPGRFAVVTVIDRLCNAPEPVEIVLLSGEEENGGNG